MNNNFYYSFPALKGIQAGREYFVFMCPLEIVSKLFLFNGDDIPPEHRSQRILNKKRIPEMASYIVTNPTDYVFSSLTASIDGDFNFSPINEAFSSDVGILNVSMNSILLINDGQHRRAAIEEALKENPHLGKETISIVLFIDEGLNRSQQIFADLNRHALNVSKSIGILYDSRDPIAIFTKELLDHNKVLNRYTDKENPSLSKLSAKLFTLSSINETNAKLLSGLQLSPEASKELLIMFWDTLCETFTEWTYVFNKKLSSKELRSTCLNTNGVVLEALGLLGNYLYINDCDHWVDHLKRLNTINWDRDNSDWLYRSIDSNGRVVKNATYIKLTYNMIKKKLSLPLTKEELSYEKNLLK